MVGTVVLLCTCTHEAQDELYGKGRRLHNIGQKAGKSTGEAFCTVCTPRALSCERNGTDISPMPHIGFAGQKAKPPRRAKRVNI